MVSTLKLYYESSSAKGLVPMACLQEIISKGWFPRTLMRLTSFLSQTFAFYQLFNVKGGGFSRWMITSYFSSLQGNYFLVYNVCHHLYCDDVIGDLKPQNFDKKLRYWKLKFVLLNLGGAKIQRRSVVFSEIHGL